MSTIAHRFEHLSSITRSTIRKGMVELIRNDPRPNATYSERLDRAVDIMVAKYGVRPDTIRAVFSAGANCCKPMKAEPMDGSMAFPSDRP